MVRLSAVFLAVLLAISKLSKSVSRLPALHKQKSLARMLWLLRLSLSIPFQHMGSGDFSGTNPQDGLESKVYRWFTDGWFYTGSYTLRGPDWGCLRAQRSLDSRADAPVLTPRGVLHGCQWPQRSTVTAPCWSWLSPTSIHICLWMPLLGHCSLAWRQTTGALKLWT